MNILKPNLAGVITIVKIGCEMAPPRYGEI